jgi:hypothetical protein
LRLGAGLGDGLGEALGEAGDSDEGEGDEVFDGFGSGLEVTRLQSTLKVSMRCSIALRSASSESLASNTTTHPPPSGLAATVYVVAPSTPQPYQVCIFPE